jgi:hypothetical protein
MPLEEWKQLPFPGVVGKGDFTAPICSDNPRASGMTDPLPVTQSDRTLGVVVCSYYTDHTTKLGFLLGSSTFTMRSQIPIGESHLMTETDYAFYQGRLFRIRGNALVDATADIVDGLTARFGKPVAVAETVVQNKAGASFPRTTYEWDVGQDHIVVQSPGAGRIDRVGVLYFDKAVAAALQTDQERLDPAINKM